MSTDTVSLEWHTLREHSVFLKLRVGLSDMDLTLFEVKSLKDFLGALSPDQINDICLNPDNCGYIAEIRNPTAVRAIT